MLENYQGYTWQSILTEASIVTVFLYLRVPDIHLKRAWVSAHLMSFIGNALGGKSTGGKKLPRWKMFSPTDFLPFFARPEGFQGEDLLPPHLCSLLMRAAGSGELGQASWVIQAIELNDSIERISQVAEEFDALDNEEASQESETLARAGVNG